MAAMAAAAATAGLAGSDGASGKPDLASLQAATSGNQLGDLCISNVFFQLGCVQFKCIWRLLVRHLVGSKFLYVYHVCVKFLACTSAMMTFLRTPLIILSEDLVTS